MEVFQPHFTLHHIPGLNSTLGTALPLERNLYFAGFFTDLSQDFIAHDDQSNPNEGYNNCLNSVGMPDNNLPTIINHEFVTSSNQNGVSRPTNNSSQYSFQDICNNHLSSNLHNIQENQIVNSARQLLWQQQLRNFSNETLLGLADRYKENLRLECNFCGKKYQRKGALIRHVKIVHENFKAFPCKWCDKKFNKKCELKEHNSYCNDDIIICRDRLEGEITKAEVAVDREVKTFHCKVCGKSFDEKERLAHLKSVHHYVEKFYCNYCDDKCDTEEDLRVHVEIAHNQNAKPFTCNLCNKEFSAKDSLVHYQKDHRRFDSIMSDVKAFCCNVCNKRFTAKKVLRHYEKKHQMVAFDCKECGKKFISLKSNLNMHSKNCIHVITID